MFKLFPLPGLSVSSRVIQKLDNELPVVEKEKKKCKITLRQKLLSWGTLSALLPIPLQP